MPPINHRYDFVYLFDVENGNPNGDPDAGNLPRVDPKTNRGLVTDVCLKRKIRNFVALARDGRAGYGIYVQEGAILNEKHREAYIRVRPDDRDVRTAKKLSPRNDNEADALRRFMCDNFFDIRTFGGVLSTGINCGQVRGPVQFTFAHSVEPITPIEVSITRMAATNEAEQKQRQEADQRTENRTMGRKHIVPYGLYRAHGFVSARLANDSKKGTGFSSEDLELFWRALADMFDHDRSAARGEMAARKLVVFEHESELGNAPAHALFERISVKRRRPDGGLQDCEGTRANGGASREPLPPARSFADYSIEVDRDNLPKGITLHERL
jgi:CRISPR-associated protein Csd2